MAAHALLLKLVPGGLAHGVVVELEPRAAPGVQDVGPVVARVDAALVHHDSVEAVLQATQLGLLVHSAHLVVHLAEGGGQSRDAALHFGLPTSHAGLRM